MKKLIVLAIVAILFATSAFAAYQKTASGNFKAKVICDHQLTIDDNEWNLGTYVIGFDYDFMSQYAPNGDAVVTPDVYPTLHFKTMTGPGTSYTVTGTGGQLPAGVASKLDIMWTDMTNLNDALDVTWTPTGSTDSECNIERFFNVEARKLYVAATELHNTDLTFTVDVTLDVNL